MLPGKKYGLDDLLRIARRRMWVVLVPLAAVSALTAVGARLVPDRYRAETTILVVPQRVPESYVKSTVTTRIEDRLQSITQQILSRTRLERIIQDFDLYASDRRTGLMEDVVERMRRDVTVQVVKGDAFRVTYSGEVPATVVKVTDRLASLFIEENLRDREVLAEGTSQFLQAQLDDARAQLVTQERKLEAYRKRFAGQLPSQLESNLQAIHNTELQIQALVDSTSRERDRRLVVERMLADLAVPDPAVANVAGTAVGEDSPAPDQRPTSAAEQLETVRSRLRVLEGRLTAEHPDVISTRRLVGELEAKAAGEEIVSPQAPRNRRIAELRAEADRLDQEIARRQEQEQQLRAVAADYQVRVDAVPSRESEMAELTRDYTTLQSLYTNLLTKKEESIIAANLERRQIGEQFKLLDAARLPEKPYSPNRPLVVLIAAVAGLIVGVGIAALLEYRDSSFRSDEDVARVLGLPALAVSMTWSNVERKRQRTRRLAVDCTCAAIVAGGLATVLVALLR